MSLAGKYIQYKLFARHKHGHGIHSPFVYDLVRNVFIRPIPKLDKLEKERSTLLKNDKLISVNDLGAGSKKFRSSERKISDIARYSLKEKKYAGFIYNLTEYLKPGNIIEFGTSFGITTAYMALANPDARIVTYEGCRNISEIAKTTFSNIGLNNIMLRNLSFDKAMDQIKQKAENFDQILIDGNHTYNATIKYFKFFLDYSHENSIFLFDDIYWSREMKNAWETIKKHPASIVTIDLFSMGIVFLNPALTKKDYVIKY